MSHNIQVSAFLKGLEMLPRYNVKDTGFSINGAPSKIAAFPDANGQFVLYKDIAELFKKNGGEDGAI